MRTSYTCSILYAALALASLASCSSLKERDCLDDSQKTIVLSTQQGIASMYTSRQTASGQAFSSAALCCAHRTWPMGTKVRVTNLSNGREVIVRVNDRGPFIRGRVIDLTPAAAAAIGLTRRQGITKVRIERLN